MLKQHINSVKNDEVNILESTYKVLEKIKKLNSEYNCFNTISEDLAIQQAKNLRKDKGIKKKKIPGLFVSVKDCLCVKNVESTAGSRILKGYKPLFNATAIQKLIDEGAIIIGKTAQDEFGFGGFSTNVGLGYQIPKNPIDKEHSCGGSSGGSACITQLADFPHISVAESTGGSIANPASFCGVYGLTPSYGLISRYGLIDYGNSLDKIGLMSKTPELMQEFLDIMSGKDLKDSTSLHSQPTKTKIKKVALVSDLMDGVEPEIEESTLNYLKDYDYEEIKLPITKKYSLAVYYILALSEASTNLAKYCGLRYGQHEKLEGNFTEYFSKTRSKHFGKEAKRRIIIGTFARMAGFRDAYYMKAAKVRTLIINEYKETLKKYEIIATPTMPIFPPKFKEIEKLTPLQNYLMDILTAGPNLAGLPHLNIPLKTKLPSGILLTADHFNENLLTSNY
ncbi:Asp-tRNA(Asn)/Glu-tRNA(Gln) amidotransferase subunit GatA [Candidatus Woesearchaeota archaeon]|nr:Asp-tRNA(Asn)/Glu-tRNA(Gln) amidotransferase subunit GatA [Candidatus Woesearchaeota archaeon]